MKKIKGKHVLIVTSGSSLKKYWDKIKKFIDEENVIIIGCNVINDFLTPDYHFWGSSKRWKKHGNKVSKKSIMVFPSDTDEGLIRKHWEGSYKTCDISKRLPGSDIKSHRTIYHYFKNVGMVAILWAYMKKASKISVVGMDGYTFYSKDKLKNKDNSQHCYGKGFTDAIASSTLPNFLKHIESRDKDSDAFYEASIKKDMDIYKTLRAINEYGAKFEILTPTVYKDFYNPDILGIEEKYER